MNRSQDMHETLRLDVLSKKQRLAFVVGSLVSLAVCLVAGLTGPEAYYEKEPISGLGESVDLVNKPWAHGWYFSANKYSNELELYMTPHVKPGYLLDRRFTRDIHLNLRLTGETYDGRTVQLTDETVPRRVSCSYNQGERSCEDVLVFWDAFVSYERYSWVISLVNKSIGETDWIENVDFTFRAERIEFAVWQIRMNYLCFGISVAGLIFWYVVCRRDQRRANRRGVLSVAPSCCCPYRTPTQRWILALAVGVALYNQPLYGFQYVQTATLRYVFIAASVAMQAAFFSILLVFWIEVFESMYRAPSRSLLFRLPKISFGITFWLAFCIVYGMTAYTANTSYVHDWTEDDGLVSAVWATCIFFGVVYLIWASFVVMRAAGHLMQFNGVTPKLVFFAHLWRLLATCAGLFCGLLNFQDVRFTHVYYFFQFLYTLYVLEVMFLYQPVDFDPGLIKEIPQPATETTSRAAVAPVTSPHETGVTDVSLAEI